jgi:hypothetical protein
MGILNNFNSSKEGRIILSIIWGFGLAAIFRKACKGRNCIVIRGPEPEEMHNKIYSFDNKCYKYRAVNTSCNKN